MKKLFILAVSMSLAMGVASAQTTTDKNTFPDARQSQSSHSGQSGIKCHVNGWQEYTHQLAIVYRWRR